MNEDIDLRPYLTRIWRWKIWIVAIAIIGALVGYGYARTVPPSYEMDLTLTFRGQTVVTNSANQEVATPLVTATDAAALLEEYKRQVVSQRGSSLVYQNVSSVSYQLGTGNTYPITVKIRLKQPQLVNETAVDAVTFLNTTDYTKTIINEQHSAIDNKLSAIDAQIGKESGNNKLNLALQKIDLQLSRSQIEGFRFLGQPYLRNNGKSLGPNTKLYALAGFIIGAGLTKIAAIGMEVRKQVMTKSRPHRAR